MHLASKTSGSAFSVVSTSARPVARDDRSAGTVVPAAVSVRGMLWSHSAWCAELLSVALGDELVSGSAPASGTEPSGAGVRLRTATSPGACRGVLVCVVGGGVSRIDRSAFRRRAFRAERQASP
ncbi:hypothetical protein ABWH91_14355 [Phycisphaerales bacterium ac7]